MGTKANSAWILVFLGVICAASGSAAGQLIAYWPLDEASGTIAHEMVHGYGIDGINLDGRFKGLPTWDPDGGRIINGRQSGAIYLHGGSDGIEAPQADQLYNPILDFVQQPMTLAFWMKTDGEGWPTAYAHMVSKGSSYRIYANGTSLNCRWRTRYGKIMNCETDVADGQWHHLCGTYDGARNFKFYVDGVLENEWDNTRDAEPYDTSYWFTIGENYYYTDYGAMEGWIDEVSVWCVALNQEQICELMNPGPLYVNFPPVVEAGPPQIRGLPEGFLQPAEVRLNGFVEDGTVFGTNVLNWTWKEGTNFGGLMFYQADGVTPQPAFRPDLNGVVQAFTPHFYEIVLTASDGVLEANDIFLLDIRQAGWTGELIKYSFENNLDDTGADSEFDDSLIAWRYHGIDDYEQQPAYDIVSNQLLLYEPGIVGQALRLEDVDISDYPVDPELEQPQPDVSGTMLKTDISFDTALHGFGTFTIEAFIKPDPDINVLGRLLYIAEVDYDRNPWQPVIPELEPHDMYYTALNAFPSYTLRGWFNEDVCVVAEVYPPPGYEMEAQIPAEEWTHFAFTGDSREITLWVNGFKIASKLYNGVLNFILDFPYGMRLSSVFDDRSFQGLMDEVIINVQARDEAYMKSRVLLIPIQLEFPHDGLRNAGLGQVLRWSRIKGPFRDVEYEVYFGEEAGDLPLVATTTDLFYEPMLDYDTTYYWYVKPVPQGTASELRSFTTQPAGFDTLLAHWMFDEGAGTVINDSATGLNDVGVDWNYVGIIHGSGDPDFVDGWMAAERGYAGHFSGEADNYVAILKSEDPDADAEAFGDLVNDSYTVALWAKVDEPGFINPSIHFMAQGDSYGLGRYGTTDHARYYAEGVCDLEGVSDINDGQWHQVAAVYDLVNLKALLFVDGQLEASSDFAPTAIHGGDTGPLLIGSNYQHLDQSFNGAVDDVRIYRHYALSEAEIQGLYQMGYAHKRPAVDAGDNQIINGSATALSGSVNHDGLPPGDFLMVAWTQVEGPTGVVITPADGLNPSVSNLAPGVYTFRLTVFDDAYQPYDEVKVWVQAGGAASKEVLYVRFEEDITSSDPLLLTVANEPVFGNPFIHVPLDALPHEPEYVGGLEPNVPVDTIPLSGAANQFALRWPDEDAAMEGKVETYPELTFAEEITVEFFAEIGDQDDLTIINCPGAESGFRIFAPRALTIRYYIESDLPGRTERVELRTNINLSDYTTGSGVDEEYFAVGWKHVAWTYEKATGIARVFDNGVPAYITGVNGVARPGEFLYDGPDGRGLALPGLLDADSNPVQLTVAHIDNPGSLVLFDELRITAAPLLPREFLTKSPNYCATALIGDLNGDCQVDFRDYVILAGYWLKNTDPYSDK